MIYYDERHRLIWQKDLPEPASFIRAVPRGQVVEAFSEAEQMLQDWAKEDGEDRDDEMAL